MRIAQWTGLWALLCFPGIVAPGVADADWKLDRAQAVAAKAWNDPCPGRVQVLYAPPLEPGWLASTIVADCRITLSDREPWPWSQLCPVLVHEYGHLAGYRDPANPGDPFHSHDPDDIMYAFIHPDRRCKDHGGPYLGRAAQGIAGGITRKKPARARRTKKGGRKAAAPRSGMKR
jgi:hypothetical protein